MHSIQPIYIKHLIGNRYYARYWVYKHEQDIDFLRNIQSWKRRWTFKQGSVTKARRGVAPEDREGPKEGMPSLGMLAREEEVMFEPAGAIGHPW